MSILVFNNWSITDQECTHFNGTPIEAELLESSEVIIEKSNHQACYQHENELRRFMIERSREGLNYWRQLVNCQRETSDECQDNQRIFDSYVTSIGIYREVRHIFYQRVAQNWFQEQLPQRQEMMRPCLISRDRENAEVQLGQHVRTLAIQNNQQAELCAPIIAGYELEVTSRVAQVRRNPTIIGFTPQELAKLDDFENSDGAYLLSEQTLGNPHLTEQQLRENIIRDFEMNIANLESFITSIESLPLSQLDQLYVYHDFYENQFLPTLGERRETYYPHCLQSRTGECGRLFINEENALTDDSDLDRCYNSISNHFLDLIPGRSSIRSANNYTHIAAARTLELLTNPEEESLRNQTDLQFVLGLPILDLAGFGMIDNIGSSTIRASDGLLIRISDDVIPTGTIADDLAPSGAIEGNIRRHSGSAINRIKQELSNQGPEELPEQEAE